MKMSEMIERGCRADKKGLIFDPDGNEYRNEEGSIEYLELEELDDKTDGLLLLEFRQKYWDHWIVYCKENGYKPE